MFDTPVEVKFTSAECLIYPCRTPDIALHLAASDYTLTGFDLAPRMIEQARCADLQQRVAWVARGEQGNALPFDDKSFDAVVASSVLEYLPALDATLKEFARILRPGGWLIATVPDMRDPHRRHERLLRFALLVPGLAAMARRSRWREGAAYLRISSNRMVPDVWHRSLRQAGLSPEPLPAASGPLLLLQARKEP